MISKFLLLTLVVFFLSGCSYFALLSPEVAIDKYHRVGVINFTSESKGNLNQILTQTFLKEIRNVSKKALIIELSDESKLLESAKETEMNPAAINAIAKKYDLDAIVTGKTEVHDVKPQFDVYRSSTDVNEISGNPLRFRQNNTPNTGYRALRVKFDVDASLNVSLIEAKTLDTVWSGSAREKKTVTPVNTYPVKGTIGIFFDEKEPKETHKELTDALVQDIIHKLRIK